MNNKYFIHFSLLASLLFIMQFGKCQNKKITNYYTIQGRIKNFGKGQLIAEIQNSENNTIYTDTINIVNDTFLHKSYLTEPQIITYYSEDKRFSTYRKLLKDGQSVIGDFSKKEAKSIQIVADFGAIITINGEAKKYLAAYPKGDIDNSLIGNLNRELSPIYYELGNIDYTDKKNFKKNLLKEDSLDKNIKNIKDNFIRRYPSSIVSSKLILEIFEDKNLKDAEADSLMRLLKPSSKDIYFKNILLLKNNLLPKEYIVGDIFPYFQTNMVYNQAKFALKETKGKFVLIDFWGTWCIPCVKELPTIYDFYKKNKDKIYVIGIAKDPYLKWKKFLDKNNYSWIQILDETPIKLREKLKIKVYPTKYLLDKSGKIIMIFKDINNDALNEIQKIINH